MRSKYRKILRIACLLIVIALFLSGCKDENIKQKGEKIATATPEPVKKPQEEQVEQDQFAGPVLVWVIPDWVHVEDAQEDAFNSALDELGCKYHVQFEEIPNEEYEEYLGQMEVVDIASAGFFPSNEQSAAMLKSGFFEPLNSWLAGTDLYNHYSEKIWNTVRINEELYTIPSTAGNMSEEYYVFNKEFFNEEQVNELELSIGNLEELLTTLPQTDKFSPLVTGNFLTVLADEGINIDNGVVFSEISGIMSLGDSEEVRNICQLMQHYYESGYLNYAFAANMEHMDYPELSKAYKELEGVDRQLLIDRVKYGILITTDKASLPAEGKAIIKSRPTLLRNKTNGGVGIAAASKHKEEAFDLLSRFFTDTMLQRILISPGEDITTENAEHLYQERLIDTIVFGTRDLFFTDYIARNEYYDTMVPESAYCGFHPDFGVDKDVLNHINELVNMYLYIWALPDSEMWATEFQEKLHELGAEFIAATVREQYECWKK